MSDEEKRGMNIIIFEGGGAGGLSSLFVFRELIARVRAICGSCNMQKLCDFMAGSGTGALIACMLGLLGMDIEQAITTYARLVERVFSDKKMISASGSGAYKASKLEEELKIIIREATGDENTRMMGDEAGRSICKVMTFAMSEHSMTGSTPCLFRSYQGLANQMPNCPMWQAIRASMAHPELFKSITIDDGVVGESLIGGDVGCSNPAKHVLAEVSAMYPDQYVSSIVCIGTGHARTIQIPRSNPLQRFMPTNVLVAMKNVATDSERVAQEMAAQFMNTSDLYWRFSVDQGMQDLHTSQWQKKNEVMAHARAYMRKAEVTSRMGEAAQSMVDRKAVHRVRHVNGKVQQPSSQRVSLVKRPPAPSPVFTGCGGKVSQVVDCLLGPANERRVCVVRGLGGSGKTQIALKSIEQTLDKWIDIAYVDATSTSTIESALRSFALAKQIGETHEDAVRWLERSTDSWLLVLDNADDPGLQLIDYLPGGTSGSVLVTTRLSGLVLLGQGPGSDCAVDMMEKNEAVELLMKKARRAVEQLPSEEAEAAAKLVEDFGCLALAVVHAGAYICCSKTSIVSYRKMCQENTQIALEKYSKLPVSVEQYKKTVYTTWTMSYNRLSLRCQRFLWITAYFHHNTIKQEIFQRAASHLDRKPSTPIEAKDEAAWISVNDYLRTFLSADDMWDSSAFSAVVDELMSYSFIDYDRVNDFYTVHVLVQDWSRTVVPHALSEALKHASHLLALSIDGSDNINAHTYRRGLVVHVSKVLGTPGAVITNDASYLAKVYKENGQWKEEENLLSHVLEEQQREYGEEHPGTLESMFALAETYYNQGRLEEAEAMQVKQLEASKIVHGDNHTETLSSMCNMALTFMSQGRWDEAEALQVKVLDACRQRLGEHHPDTLTSMNNLASTHWGQGRWDEAEALNVKVLDARRERQGEHHPHTLGSMNNLASTYSRQGRWDEAEALEVKVVDARRERLGEHHPHTLSSMSNLALTYSSQGRWDEAEALNVKVLDARRERLGEHHSHTLTSMSNLASTYSRQGRWDEAEALNVKVLDACRERLGEHHPDTLTSMYNLARTYQHQKRCDKAETLLVQTVAACKRVYGEQHREVLDALQALSKSYEALGEDREDELDAVNEEIARVEAVLG